MAYSRKELLAAQVFNGMQKRSKRRQHPLEMRVSEFIHWSMQQESFRQLCEDYFVSGMEPYSKLKPSINRLDDREPYSYENIEWITWGEHLKYTSQSRLENAENSLNRTKAVILLDKELGVACRYNSTQEAKRDGYGNHVDKVCRGDRDTSHGARFVYEEDYRDNMYLVKAGRRRILNIHIK